MPLSGSSRARIYRAVLGWMAVVLICGCDTQQAGVPPQLAKAPARDTYRITLDASIADDPQTGRLLVFFIDEIGDRWRDRSPCLGPFEESPQPIAAIDVTDLAPGDTLSFDQTLADTMPRSLDSLRGKVLVQAVLDVDETQRHHLQGPGNLVSEIIEIDLDNAASQTIELTLSRRINGPGTLAPDSEHLLWVSIRSDLLSSFAGRDVMHNAGVALPPGYHDDPDRRWPIVYVVPEFARRHHDAAQYADMFATPGIERVAPMAIHVVLDPEAPLGHHGFVDSENNGPRATALVEELIPHIDATFQTDTRHDARIVTGHGAGGWAALWLQLQHPDMFGACWATSPDPVSFMALQMNNIYMDENFFEYAEGHETIGMRDYDRDDRPIVLSTQREQARMESIVGPGGTSGMRLDSWEARYAPHNAPRGLPTPLFDDQTGRIDSSTTEFWKQRDISINIVRNWQTMGRS